METILGITEFEGQRPNWGSESGFKITTDEQVITLAISDNASCCEHWGYFLTEDDPAEFVGAELRGVTLTDTNRSSRTFGEGWRDDDNHVSLDAGDVMFVDIETDRGVLQFVAYNAHNGYYGHEARIESRQLKHEAYL